VTHAAAVFETSQTFRSCGITAEAENHVLIDTTSVMESSVSACHRPRSASLAEGSGGQ
jgi:hypothetical protein